MWFSVGGWTRSNFNSNKRPKELIFGIDGRVTSHRLFRAGYCRLCAELNKNAFYWSFYVKGPLFFSTFSLWLGHRSFLCVQYFTDGCAYFVSVIVC